MELKYDSLEQLSSIAQSIISFAENDKVWLLEGDMGAGKTTLVSAIGKELGFVDTVSSPTFSIVNEYLDAAGSSYYHFDFYRINDEEEAVDIGTEEYFYSGNVCFVEWSSKIESLIPDKYLKISINFDSEYSRTILLSRHDRTI
uniref:tRNA (adenosine(37)-N6)-threonylcarbamoyltransferase complex ATPase subunit type 1 TsaE n=1 Tax=Fulvivirga sp. TaxID=1931237 RepID=UPI004049507B